MDDNKVAVLLEDFAAKFRTFAEGLDGSKGRSKRSQKRINRLPKRNKSTLFRKRPGTPAILRQTE